jgi:replicative DNA helicase
VQKKFPSGSVDVVILSDNLDMNGKALITFLLSSVPDLLKVNEYKNLIILNSRKRQLVNILLDSTNKLASGLDLPLITQTLQEDVKKINISKTDPLSFYQSFEGFEAELSRNAQEGIISGITDLDDLIGSFKGGDLNVIASRPGVGKTTFSFQYIDQAVLNKKRVLYYSLEMSAFQMRSKVLSKNLEINSRKFRNPKYISKNELEKLSTQYESVISLYSNYLRFEYELSDIDEIIHQALKEKSNKGFDIMIIDYVQLISTSNIKQNRNEQLGYITRSLKRFAQEQQIPIILLSQINRDSEKNQSKYPTLSSLKDSGNIEQDGDIIIALHNNYNYSYTEEDKNKLDIIVLKNRHGEPGKIKIGTDYAFGKYYQLNNNYA